MIEKQFSKSLIESLPTPFFYRDLNGVYKLCNQAYATLYGLKSEELIGKTLDEVVSSEIIYNLQTDAELLANPLKIQIYDTEVTHKNTTYHIRVLKDVYRDAQGEIIGVVGSVLNHTKRKLAEKDLIITKNLIETGPVVVFEWSGEEGWPIKFVSKNVEQVLGLDYKKLSSGSRNFSDYICSRDLEQVVNEVTNYITTKTTKFLQSYSLITETNEEIYVNDYTIVEYSADGTPQTIKGYLFDISEEKRAQAKIQKLLFCDQLTGLPNRQKILKKFQEDESYACAIFNINGFGEINDFFGSQYADEILIQLANAMQTRGRETYRIGGDEFAILFHESISKTALIEWAKEQLEYLADLDFHIGSEVVKLHINVGLALSSDKLLTHADIALHQAKADKKQFVIYEANAHIEKKIKKNIGMATNIHKALNEKRIICHYQPIYDVKKAKIVKYETLVRMVDIDGKIIAPFEFLDIAKKTKLYSKITQTVVEQACYKFQNRDEEFSINISIDDINDPVTVQMIITTILDTETASRVVFEILETEGIENYDSVIRFVRQVKSLGSKVAIDDFGSGYSNFQHLIKLNIDYIKIDGSLIKEIATNEKIQIIVETISDFSRKIGAQVIAEFVSDAAIFEKIKSMDLDFAQGYHIGKPEPIDS